MSTRNQPQSGNAMPRFAGLATMMRLPAADSPQGLDAAFIGVPLDIGTSNRAGARFGPRQVRAESALLRPYNMATGAAPPQSECRTCAGLTPRTGTVVTAAISAIRISLSSSSGSITNK